MMTILTKVKTLSVWYYAILAIFILLVCLGSSNLMRESDQASIIDGAYQLSNGGSLVGRTFYNYDMQYISYWILGAVYWFLDLCDLPASPDLLVKLVGVGNAVAAFCFVIGVVTLVLNLNRFNWWKCLLLSMGLFSPVILYSAPLLSPAIISAGFLLILGVSLNKRASLFIDIIAMVLAFLAVGSRMDAVLAMPFLAFFAVKGDLVPDLFKTRRIWFVGVGSLLAIAVGKWIYPFAQHEPNPFFNAPLYLAYLVFGLNGVLWAVIFLVVAIIRKFLKTKEVLWALSAVAVILPMLYYSAYFFSPRYLILLVVILLLSLQFKRGQDLWSDFMKQKWARVLLCLAAAHSIVALFIGIGMSSKKSGSLVVGNPTVFPTADGHWPMGSNLFFFKKLAQADDTPIDHNQRIWNAWCSVEPALVSGISPAIRSNGLLSLGRLWFSVNGLDSLKQGGPNNLYIVDGRSLMKSNVKQGGAYNPRHDIDISGSETVQQIGFYRGESIFLVNGNSSGRASEWADLELFKKLNEGDDLVILEHNKISQKSTEAITTSGSHEWFFIVPIDLEADFQTWVSGCDFKFITSELVGARKVSSYRGSTMIPLSKMRELSSKVIIARSSLPSFMKRENMR